MRPKTEDEIYAEYVADLDPKEQDLIGDALKETYSFKAYLMHVRGQELGQAIIDETKNVYRAIKNL